MEDHFSLTTALVIAVIAGLALGVGLRLWAPRIGRHARGSLLWRYRGSLQTAGLVLATVGLATRYLLEWAVIGRGLFLGGLAIFLVGLLLDRAAASGSDGEGE